MNSNHYQRNLQYRWTSSEPLHGKHCLQRIFNSFHSCRRRNYLRPSTLYFSIARGHNNCIIPQLPWVISCFSTHRIKIFQTSIQTTKKWHSRPLWSYISTFLGSLLATYCVYCSEWPNNLLTTLSFRFQAKTSSVIICSLISFPPMCEWYLLKLTITFLQGLPSRLQLWLHS